jgi:histidinol-phosphate aminotransferase
MKMTNQITPRPGIMEIDPYMGGESHVPGVAKIHKLSSNENPLGPSPKAIAAFKAVAGTLERYPSSDHAGLRIAIGQVHGVDPSRVICGDGSDEVISWLCNAYAGPGDEVLFTAHGFSMYRISALGAGATPVEVAETKRRVDVDKLLAGCTANTRLVFLANPGNPTGTMISEAEMARLADGLPPQALLVLDGAYADFVEGFDGGLALVEARNNVFMTRTFSKIYGLGGLRVGWGYGPAAIIDVLNRIRGPFNVTAAGLAAAQAAVLDLDYTDRCRAENTRWRDWLQAELAAIGIPSDQAFGNFILTRFGSEIQADKAEAALRMAGILVRKVKGYRLPDCLRITVGDEEACRLVVDVMTKFMKERD